MCALLDGWFTARPGAAEAKGTKADVNFKRILLNECQVNFEKFLRPREEEGLLPGVSDGGEEEEENAARKYKSKMLGNMEFVGQLLVRTMLSPRVFLAIAEQLLVIPTDEPREALAKIMSTVGPTFNQPE